MIRPRQTSDLTALIAVMRQVHEQDAYPSIWPAQPLDFTDPPQTLAAWVAESHGQVVGQVLLREVTEPLPEWVAVTGLTASEVAVLSRFFVAPSERGRGLAQALFQAAWQEAERLGRRAILDVHQKNKAAIRLYGREGWAQVATVTAPFTDPDGTHPLVHVFVAPAEIRDRTSE